MTRPTKTRSAESHWLVLTALVFSASGLSAQPFVYHRGVINAASYAPPGLPNGPLARGSIFTIFGRNLGPAEAVQASAFPLGDTLGGVSIELCRDGVCIPAIPIYVAAGQVNAIIPSNAPLGPASLRLTFAGQTGNFTPVEIVSSSVGMFAVNSGGFGPGVLQNFVAEDNQPVNSASDTARPGQVITLWATGLGAALNDNHAAPEQGSLPVQTEVFVGGKVARVDYAGRSQCCSGLDQINIVVPNDAPLGCNVPVTVRTVGAVVSNDVTMALSAGGGPCANPLEPAAAALAAGGRIGRVGVSRHLSRGPNGQEFVSELAYAAFTEEVPSGWAFHPNFNTPPIGSCLTYLSRGAIGEVAAITTLAPSIRRYDVGPDLTVTTPLGSRLLTPRPLNLTGYAGLLGSSGLPIPSFEPILATGVLARVSIPGGPDLAAFDVEIAPPAAPDWTNRDAVAVVNRQQGLTVTWRPQAGPAPLWISGGGSDDVSDAFVLFVCRAQPETGEFTIPAHVLGRVPPYRDGSRRSQQFLQIQAETAAQPAAPAGLDRIFVDATSAATRTVEYR